MAAPLDDVRTARLRLVRMVAADLDDLDRLHQDARVMATLGGVRSRAETRQLLDDERAHWAEHGFGLWTVRDPTSNRFLGRGGLRVVPVGGRREVEVAYALLPDCWGRGLATELAGESARTGFDVLRRPDLVCFTRPDNHPSRRVMEKVGFRYEREIAHADLLHVLYRLTAAGWRAQRGRAES